MWRDQPPPIGQPERRARRKGYLAARRNLRAEETSQRITVLAIECQAKEHHQTAWFRTLRQIYEAERSLAEYIEAIA